ncbi:primosomal N' domain protein, partial [Chlamydia psittaci 84-8471/1]
FILIFGEISDTLDFWCYRKWKNRSIFPSYS